MKKQIYSYLLLALLAATFTACEEYDFRYQDISSRLRLTSEEVITTNAAGVTTTTRADSVFFSFRLLSNETTEVIARFEAHLIGIALPEERVFKLEVVEEGTNVPASVYELVGSLVVPANAYYGTVSVKIQRTVPGLDLTDPAKPIVARVKFRVVANENFLPHGEDIEFTVMWCDYLGKPESWTSYINTYVGQFSQSLYRFFMEVTGETELTRYNNSLSSAQTLRDVLRRELAAYNAKADADGRPHWKADDGKTDLVI